MQTSNQNTKNWFLGNQIKKFIIDQIFNKTTITNSKIKLNYWSAYAHYEPDISILNLLDKVGVDYGSNILASPLISNNILDQLSAHSIEFKLLDIDIWTEQFNIEKLVKAIQNYNPQVVIMQVSNGYYQGLIEQIKMLNNSDISVIVYVDKLVLTFEFINFLQHSFNGGIVINCAQNIFNPLPNFDPVIWQTTSQKNVVLSWFFEQRINSKAEYHLKHSLDVYYPFLVQRARKNIFKKAVIKPIKNNSLILKSAIPDIFFEYIKQTRLFDNPEDNHRRILNNFKNITSSIWVYNQTYKKNVLYPNLTYRVEYHTLPVSISKENIVIDLPTYKIEGKASNKFYQNKDSDFKFILENVSNYILY